MEVKRTGERVYTVTLTEEDERALEFIQLEMEISTLEETLESAINVGMEGAVKFTS